MLERLTKLRDFDTTRNLSPRELVEEGLCDAIRLFVKNDPHKLAKLNDGRVRLIFSISTIDNIIARLGCALQNNTEISLCDSIPSKPGMGLDDVGTKKLYHYVEQMLREGPLDSSDLQGFDFSVTEHDLQMDLERRLDLNSGRGTVWERVMRAHYYCMSRKVMVLSDGSMYQQIDYGLMPSGWYNTSGSNSTIRIYNHSYIAVKQDQKPCAVAMGDDCAEKRLKNAKDEYRRLGKILTDHVNLDLEDFEFCSTQFVHGKGRPVNVDKQIVALLNTKPDTYAQCAELFDQFTFEMRNHPQLDAFTSLIYATGWWKEM